MEAMTWFGFRGSMLLRNTCQTYVIRMRSLALTLLQVPGLMCIAISTGWAREGSTAMTDSVIYFQPKDENNLIDTGDMTSELHSTEHVSEFVSGGPKN